MADMIQTCLESNAIEKRQETLVRNDYTTVDEYNTQHPDALATGDPLGKGTGSGGHTHSIPDCNKPKGMYDYSSIDTSLTSGPNGTGPGGEYDVNGRNGVGGRTFLLNIGKYGPENQYGSNIIDTSANVEDGQIIIHY